MEGDNWEDLFAVVRSSLSTSNSPTTTASPPPLHDPFSSSPPPLPPFQQDPHLLLPFFPSTTASLHELEALCKPFLPPPPPQQHPPPQPFFLPKPTLLLSPPLRSKRRKNQQKKVVCQVPADGLSSDMWAWRKYGQKPIKGSPFPRCSSSKGCPARKQVERSRKEPNMFAITYTAEHNHPVPTHRNSLAGSTRQRSSNSISVSRFLSKKGLVRKKEEEKEESAMKEVEMMLMGFDETEETMRNKDDEEEEEEEEEIGI